MLRRLILYLSTAAWARSLLLHWGPARRAARRFVAGETQADALRVIRELNAGGLLVTLDYLGESVTRAEDTVAVVATYTQIADAIKAEGLQAGLSLKLTHLGLDIDRALCVDNLRAILTAAAPLVVTIDMESSDYTETTLAIYHDLRAEFPHLGTVIQAYLYRSTDDMTALAAAGARIRLCKGAYLEPPQIAYPDKKDVDASFVRLMSDFLLHGAPDSYLDIATHDENMIAAAEALIDQHPIDPARYEFQMLYGIRSARQIELAARHKMRVYVPFGAAWYPYYMRRLAERPANVWFFIRAFFGR